MRNYIESLEQSIYEEGVVSAEAGLELMNLEGPAIYDLFPSANRIARHFKGYEVELCGIVNAKSGRCAEDCAFCAQSVHHETDAPTYDLMENEKIEAAAAESAELSANRFGIVTSGTGITQDPELDRLCRVISKISAEGKINPCASLGILSQEALKKLWDAGLRGYHHNIETAESFFPRICSTHVYEEDLNTVRAARRLGFMTCSGGIFGIGETRAHRVEMAMTLRDLKVQSIPLNFLIPVKGTRLEDSSPLPALECLKIIAVYRMLLPEATIKVCAGRDRCLGDLSSWIFYAGANGMMVGHYLTTAGRDPETDIRMVKDLGFRPLVNRS